MRSTGQSEKKLSDSMTFSDHLEELRQRILNSIYSILISICFSFLIIKPLISFLEIPAGDIHLLQLAPGEFLFVAIKVAGYSGLIVSMPYIFYQIILFISPGLTKRSLGRDLISNKVLSFDGLLIVILQLAILSGTKSPIVIKVSDKYSTNG